MNGLRGTQAFEKEAAALLSRTNLFADLDEDALRGLAGLSAVQTYAKGETVFGQGDPGDALYVVMAGEVKVHVESSSGDEMVLVTLRTPDVFGELALVDGRPRSASVEALVPTSLLSIAREGFLLLAHNPDVAELLFKTLGAIVRRLTEQASDLVFLDLYGRVAKLIVGLAAERGEPTPEGICVDLHVTQTDLAGMVGGSRQSVNQILRAFERRDYVDLDGRRVTVKRPELLKKRAGLLTST
ncbi:MAG: Crp/Fnr family transcriptional regulator [Actinomycetota bacterium]|nr:Crp/Fnr family transcriptional regulator [Actinomycetota bacterium]